MPFNWTARQFVGGALCLDFVNTVFYAEDPARRGDRLIEPEDIPLWCAAAIRFGAGGRYASLLEPSPSGFEPRHLAEAIALRQSIDHLFRAASRGEPAPARDFAEVTFCLGRHLGGCLTSDEEGFLPQAPGPDAGTALAAIAHSALTLSTTSFGGRLKTCPNCHWLFLDRSRNASRVWCDMLTCGNRAKAERHYANRRVTV